MSVLTADPTARRAVAPRVVVDRPPGAPDLGGRGAGETSRPEGAAIRIFVVFADGIYARGLQASLQERPDIHSVRYSVAVPQALLDHAFSAANVVLLECDLPGAVELARRIALTSTAHLLVCARHTFSSEIADLMCCASGVLPADRLTPDIVIAAIRTVRQGMGVLGIDLLRDLSGADTERAGVPTAERPRHLECLTSREHAVLSLVAAGVPSREIATRLSYSERTIKNIVHDVIMKLGARSRAHAVAVAVREGLI